MKNKTLSAWDGRFTKGQLQDIKSMIIHAGSEKILNMLETTPPEVKSSNQISIKAVGKILCPKCNKKMNMSAIGKVSKKYKEGFRTFLLCGASCCNNKGCGFQVFSKLTVNEILKKGVYYDFT